MHNVIKIMVMIASVCQILRQQKCRVVGEPSDNSDEYFRYLKMRQTQTDDKSSRQPSLQYLGDPPFKSNHSSNLAKLPFSSLRIIDDDMDDDGSFKWPLIEVTSSTRPRFQLKKDHCFVTRFDYRKILL